MSVSLMYISSVSEQSPTIESRYLRVLDHGCGVVFSGLCNTITL